MVGWTGQPMATACPPRQNGNTLVGQGPLPSTVLATPSLVPKLTMAISTMERCRWEATVQTIGDFLTCTGMFGNGAGTGVVMNTIYRVIQWTTPEVAYR